MRRHRTCPVIVLAFAALATTVWAQPVALSTAPPAATDSLLREGFELYDRDEYQAAGDRFGRALALALDAGDLRAQAEAHRGIGLVYHQKAEYPTARAEFEQARILFERVADPVGTARIAEHLAVVAEMTGDWKQWRDLLSKALTEFEARAMVVDQARVLLSTSRDPELSAAQRHKLLGQALEIAAALGDRRLEGDTLRRFGDFYFSVGDFGAAMAKLESAIALLEEAGAKKDLARALTSLGRLHRAHGYVDQAQELYRRALAIQEEIGDQQGAIQSINAIAVTHDSQGKPREALAEYERALALARQTGSPRIINFQLGNLANAMINADRARAVALLTEVLQKPIDPWLAAYRYNQLSYAYLGLGRPREALEAADKSIELTRTAGSADELAGRLDNRARARAQLGQTSDALADEREALRAIEQTRARLVPTDFMKRGFSNQNQQVFAFTIELLGKLGHDAQALEVAEQARARAFLDLLATRGQADTPASTSTAESPAAAIATPPRQNHVDALVLRGGGDIPPSDLKSPRLAAALSVNEIGSVARELQSTLLVYYVTQESTLIWVVQPSSAVHATRVAVSAERLKDLIRQTRPDGRFSSRSEPTHIGDRRALASRGGDVFFFGSTRNRAWHALYQLLIRPVRDQLPVTSGSRIAIVPHGPLFLLSFASLQDEAGRYLIEKYTLHYTPSAALLRVTHERRKQFSGDPARYLFVADPAGMPSQPDHKPLPALPGTRREVTTIARLLAPNTVAVLAGPQADERDVRERMRDATVIHFATHGVVRDDEPLDSFLALGRSSAVADEDGRLTATKIYELDLRAEVVVLSACRTALGEISGDGIAGLTRAFLYAGASSVVATMWDVADEPTVQLMPTFYRSLARGRDKARSLRAAQLKLLADLRSGRIKVSSPSGAVTLPEDPFFWAAFILVGEP